MLEIFLTLYLFARIPSKSSWLYQFQFNVIMNESVFRGKVLSVGDVLADFCFKQGYED